MTEKTKYMLVQTGHGRNLDSEIVGFFDTREQAIRATGSGYYTLVKVEAEDI